MSNQVQIIKLPPERWQEWKEIRHRSLKDDPQAFGESLEKSLSKPDEKFMQQVQEAYLEQKSWMYFAEIDGKLVGTVTGAISREDSNVASVFGVFVAKEARGKGIAKQVMGKLLSELRANPSFKKITLHVSKDEPNAVKLYLHFGFQIVEEESVLLGDNKYHDILVMEIHL